MQSGQLCVHRSVRRSNGRYRFYRASLQAFNLSSMSTSDQLAVLPQGPSEQMRTTPARTATASLLRRTKLSRRCRECAHEVDSIVRRQAVCEATHPDRDGPYGHVFATILGREPRVAAGPFSGQVGPGSPHSESGALPCGTRVWKNVRGD